VADTRPWPRSLAVAAAAALAGFSFGLVLVAAPLFGLAQALERNQGLDRPVIRDNLLAFALPVAVICAVLAGVLVGRWYRQGGKLPTE
jgi:hypothetical protein